MYFKYFIIFTQSVSDEKSLKTLVREKTRDSIQRLEENKRRKVDWL